MKLKYSFFLSLLWITISGFSQLVQLSPNAQISVITCGAGNDLYSAFGHSAFRVQDSKLDIDVVYNYGTFNFDTPNFYLKFVRGKLLYSLSKQRFENFLFAYQLENRWVKEQLLNLTHTDKNKLFRFLENNYKPENRDYKYDFFYNNCSTKIPDILVEVLGAEIKFQEDHLQNTYTFRQLLQQNLNTNSWASFGIDLALGTLVDNKAKTREHMFLPNYVMRQLSNTNYGSDSLVDRERTILDAEQIRNRDYFTSSPFFWLLFILMFTITITFIDIKNDTRAKWLDFFLFLVSGAVGVLIVFLWFFTDHSTMANNLNLLWFFPLNLGVCYYLIGRKQLPAWVSKYIMTLLGFLILNGILWLFKVQSFSPLIVWVFLIFGIRYLFLLHHLKKASQKLS